MDVIVRLKLLTYVAFLQNYDFLMKQNENNKEFCIIYENEVTCVHWYFDNNLITIQPGIFKER